MHFFLALFIFIYIINGFIQPVKAQDSLFSTLQFSHNHGFYDEPFQLTISSAQNIDQLWYTFDNRNPEQSINKIENPMPAQIIIDPQSAQMVSTSPSVVLRVVGLRNGIIVTQSMTQTYIFPDKITELSPDGVKPGPDWPDTNTTDTSRQYFDYGMDPDVYMDDRYGDLLINALLDIPSLSIVSAPENLFNPDTGIYVNARGDEDEWERNCSLELIYPDGEEGFQINAGIRIRGGDSRRNANPKHSFRFLFKQEYGHGQLDYALFGNEGVRVFDRIDLRTNQNFSWHASDSNRAAKTTFIREVFSRDSQRDMELPYTRSRQYHVWLNGVYWGLYMTQERPEANYGESYFGGTEQDFDVVKVDKNNDQKIYATDGTTDSWQRLFNAKQDGLASNEDFFKLQGLNTDGTFNPGYEKLLDLENFISYLLIYYYVGNYDGIVGLEWNNQKPNNFWAIFNRSDPDGFKFFAHDAEQSMASEDGVTIGLNVDRTGPYPQLGEWYWFNGQELHQELINNKEYLICFADYAYKYFFNDGVLTPENSIRRFDNRAREIELAVIGESVRWGDGNRERKDNPRTKDDDWLPAVNDIFNNYLPYRRDIVIEQLKNDGWYPAIDPPLFVYRGDTITKNETEILNTFNLQIIKPANYIGSEIIYTTDKSDPRLIGGSINPEAFISAENLSVLLVKETTIKARLKQGSTWSALHTVRFDVFEPKSDLIFSEIHYNPFAEEDVPNDQFEFIEIKNIGENPFNLDKAFFEEGIDYTFPAHTKLESGGFIVLAAQNDSFFRRYGFYPFGFYSGRLDNNGERIKLADRQSKTLINIEYNDNDSWPSLADSGGYSLTTKYPNDFSDPNDKENWMASTVINGTPGKDDIINFGTVSEKLINGFKLYQNYPNPFNHSTTIKYHVPLLTKVTIGLYSIVGQKIMTLLDDIKQEGIYNIHLDIPLASGVYIIRMKAGGHFMQRKIVLVK